MSNFTVTPSPAITKAPISIVAQGSRAPFHVIPHEISGAESFFVENFNGEVAQFSVALPGLYEIRQGEDQLFLKVESAEPLSFFNEFGVFSILVTLALGGIYIWLKRKKVRV